MDSSIIITFAIPLFFGLILIEFFYGILKKQNNYRINDAITSMSLGLISRFVPILGLGFQYVVYKAVAEQYNLKLLNGEEIWVWVTAFVLYDMNKQEIYAARDPYGVRPLYMGVQMQMLSNTIQNTFIFSSEIKQIDQKLDEVKVTSFTPGHYIRLKKTCSWDFDSLVKYNHEPCIQYFLPIETDISIILRNALGNAVRKRVEVTDRPIACLLSGGLDSSLITALVCKFTDPTKLKTFSIGLPESEDIVFAEKVAKHLNTDHTSIIMTEDDFFNAIPEVINAIESYDTTTVRASVGNYLVAKYIKENT